MIRPRTPLRLPATARALALGLALLASLAQGSAAAPPSAGERDVKAAYLCNLCRFVEWPPRARSAPVFRIVVVGDPELAGTLKLALGGGQLRGLPVHVEQRSFSERLPACDLMYSARADRPVLERLHGELGREPTLTIGEGPEFLAAGGAIAFRLEQQTVRLSVCPENAAGRGLAISSKLLRLCKIVGPRR